MTKLAPWFWTPGHHALVDDVWSDLFAAQRRKHSPRSKATPTWSPRVDVTETPEAYLLELELPGIDPEGVEVTLKEKTLTIKGEKTSTATAEGETQHIAERRGGSFSRSFTFPEAVDGDSVTATSKHGLLTVEVKKTPEAQPKRIAIS